MEWIPSWFQGEGLVDLLDRAGAAREGDEALRQLGHQGLALVHRADDVLIGEAGVGQLGREQAVGDDAVGLAARAQRGVGDGAHEADRRTAVDEPDAAVGEQGAERHRRGGVLRTRPRARAAEDTDAPHGSQAICRAESASYWLVMIRRLPHVDRVGVEERAAWLGARLDQGRRQAAGHPAGDLDARPHHARGRRHPRQGARPLRQGGLPRPGPPGGAVVRGGLRLPGAGRRRRRGAAGHRRADGRGGDRLPVGAGVAGGQAARDRGGRRGRRPGDRHGHLARGVPGRRRRARAGGDRARARGVRRRPPEGDPRDGRAGLLRARPPRLRPGDDGGRRLHQDLDRQGLRRGHARGLPGHARGDPRSRPPHRRRVGFKAAGGVSTSKAAPAPPRPRQGDAGRRLAHAGPDPHRRVLGPQRPARPVRQYAKTESGRYARAEDFSKE